MNQSSLVLFAAGAKPFFNLGHICRSTSGSQGVASWTGTRRIAARIADVLSISLHHVIAETLLRFFAAPAARRKQVAVVTRFASVSILACALQVWRGKVRERQPLQTELAFQLGAIVSEHFLRILPHAVHNALGNLR